MPTQQHTPHKEDVGDHGLVIGDSCTEVGLIGHQDRVWAGAGQIRKQIYRDSSRRW